MKRYKGEFKDIKDKTITVDIVPSDGNYTDTVDIRFTDDPVSIELSSSDGIFTPIKDKSCTIRLFSEEIYWDLYSPSSTGYNVIIDSPTEKLFRGYLTPCIYTQDYAYKAEIELEAVDYLAVLNTFDYKVNGDKDIISLHTLLNKLFGNIPNYTEYVNNTTLDFTKYYVQEANFFDDDGEPMKCNEILDELMRYLGFTAVMNGDKITIIDYSNSAAFVSENIDIKKYGSGTPTVELDEVYNKISIGCDLYEVDEVIDDLIDDDNKTVINEFKLSTSGEQLYCDYSFSWREHNHHTKDNHRYTILVKPYNFVDDTLENNKSYIASRWQSYNRDIATNYIDASATIESKANKDTKTYKDGKGEKLFIPQYLGAYPIRQYSYNKQEGMESKSKINWTDYILFPALDRNSASSDEKRFRTTYPALSFYNDEHLAYSIDGGIGYIVFNGDLWCQSDIGISGVDTDVIWTDAYIGTRKETVPMPACMENMDLSFDEDRKRAYKRTKESWFDRDYNKGWEMIKAELRIGNKYWDGTQWTAAPSTFMLRYHDDDVYSGDETFNYFTWTKAAPNPNVPKINVGTDGYAIPITSADRLHGKLEFTLWTPNQLPRTVNNFFMRDLSLKYVYKDSSNWADDKKVEDDIVYENIINETWATEMDEIDLKINSWYKDKPISKSYMLDDRFLPIVKLNNKVQEAALLEKYYNHYKTPKKIFNLNYKIRDINPNLNLYHPQTDTIYKVDSFEINVKMGETQLKLIEL